MVPVYHIPLVMLYDPGKVLWCQKWYSCWLATLKHHWMQFCRTLMGWVITVLNEHVIWSIYLYLFCSPAAMKYEQDVTPFNHGVIIGDRWIWISHLWGGNDSRFFSSNSSKVLPEIWNSNSQGHWWYKGSHFLNGVNVKLY